MVVGWVRRSDGDDPHEGRRSEVCGSARLVPEGSMALTRLKVEVECICGHM